MIEKEVRKRERAKEVAKLIEDFIHEVSSTGIEEQRKSICIDTLLFLHRIRYDDF